MKIVWLLLVLLTSVPCFGQKVTPKPCVADIGCTFTGPTTFAAPLTIVAPLTTFGQMTGAYSASSANGFNGQYFQLDNQGPNVGIGFHYTYRTEQTGGGFDGAQGLLDDVRASPVGANRPAYDLFFWWLLGPSDTANSWGIGTEFDISNRMPSTPGWHLSRGVSTYNVGNFLAAAIATSSVGDQLVNPFTTTNGSPTVAVVHADHMLQTGQYVSYVGASACNGLTLTGPYQITYVDPNNYTISAGSNATGSGTCGGTMTALQSNGTDAEYAYAIGSSADINTGTGRWARYYQGWNCEPNSTVGLGIDPSNHGGVCFEASGAGYALGANPITTNGTTTVSIAWAHSGLTTAPPNNQIVISGATAVGGFTPNGTFNVLSANATTVTFSTGGPTPTTATGGGSSVIAYGIADVPDAAFEVPFGTFHYGLRLDQGTFSGDAIKTPGFTVDGAGNSSTQSTTFAANQAPPAVASGQVWVGMVRGSSGAGFCTYEMVTSTNTQIIQANVPGGGC